MNVRYAILLCALLALGACSQDQPGAPGETSAGTPGEDASNRPAQVSPRAGKLGQGTVQGASLNGSFVYVSDAIPGSEGRGCEGAGDQVLYRVPVDGRERTMAADDTGPARGTILRGGSKGRIALIEGCEENPTRAFVATESEDGRISAIQRVPVPERSIPRLTGWSNDGLYLLGVTGDPAGDGPTPMQVVQVDPSSGDSNTLFDSEPVYRVAQLKNGSYVTQGSGTISVRTTTAVQRTYRGDFFQMSPTGDRFAVLGTGLSVVAGQGEPQAVVPGGEESTVYSASFSQDGRNLTYVLVRNEGPQVDADLGVVIDGKAKVIKSSGLKDQVSFSFPVFAAGGRYVAYNETPDDGSNPHDVVLVEVPS